MTPDEIREVFDGFIEYPEGSEKLYVTTASTLIFAQHIAKMAAAREREACAKVCDSESERGFFNWKNDIPQNKEFWNGGQMFASQLAEEIRARSQA